MVWGKKVYLSRDATAGWLFIFFFAVGTDMLANVALIHSLGSDVTRVHSHISLNISKFQSFLKIVSYFSPSWSKSPGPDVTRVHSHRDKVSNKLRTNANKTLDSFVTSFIWNNVSCFILNLMRSCASMNSFLQYPLFLLPTPILGICLFLSRVRDSEATRQKSWLRIGTWYSLLASKLPRNYPKVVPKLSQSWLDG